MHGNVPVGQAVCGRQLVGTEYSVVLHYTLLALTALLSTVVY
jgi:hypothetical protein